MKLTLTRYIHYMSKLVPEVYDIETISNLFTYVSYLPDSDEWFEFVIHRSQNDSEKLYNHLTRQGFFQVGFIIIILTILYYIILLDIEMNINILMEKN